MARKSKYGADVSIKQTAQNEVSAGLYIRLSREDGDKVESESISSQKALLQKFVEENGAITLHDYYIDDGWSGTDFERPAFQRMLADITARKINCVIVKDLSRFGRNYVEAGKYLETVFPLFNVRFIAVNDCIDSIKNPASMNSVIVPFKNIINDEYCRDISLKVRSALDIRRKQGKFIGSFAAYGYKKDENDHNKLVIDGEAADTVRFIFDKFLGGYSILGIAKELNERGVPNPSAYKQSKGLKAAGGGGLWCDSTVRRILKNELYIGNLVQKKNEVVSYKIHVTKAVAESSRITVENTHTPIISRQDFEKAQLLLKRDTRTSPNKKTLSVFAGFIKCADCGRAMQKRTVKQPYKTYDYYVCSTHKAHRGACTKHAIRADKLEEAVLAVLNKYIAIAVDFDKLAQKIALNQQKSPKRSYLRGGLATKRQELERAKKILLDLYPDYKSGLISREQYLALREKYEAEEVRAQAAIDKISQEIKNFEGGKGNAFIKTFIKFKGIKILTRDAVVELIENIYVQEGGAIEIHLKCRDEFMAAAEFFGRDFTKPSHESA